MEYTIENLTKFINKKYKGDFKESLLWELAEDVKKGSSLETFCLINEVPFSTAKKQLDNAPKMKEIKTGGISYYVKA